MQAIEERDGVEFWFDRSSPFGPPQLLRLPGLRKIEPEPAADTATARRFLSLSSFAHDRVLATSSFVSQARRAVATPKRSFSSVSAPWASESITSFTPFAAAARA